MSFYKMMMNCSLNRDHKMALCRYLGSSFVFSSSSLALCYKRQLVRYLRPWRLCFPVKRTSSVSSGLIMSMHKRLYDWFSSMIISWFRSICICRFILFEIKKTNRETRDYFWDVTMRIASNKMKSYKCKRTKWNEYIHI